MQYIAFDAHKRYTLASVERDDGRRVREERIPHERGMLRQFLARCERDSSVAVESIGNWYWIIDEIEAAGCVPRLVRPGCQEAPGDLMCGPNGAEALSWTGLGPSEDELPMAAC